MRVSGGFLESDWTSEVTISDSHDEAYGNRSTEDSTPDAPQSGLSQRSPGLVGLLQPHAKALVLGVVAVIGEGAANLLEPWPLKFVFDNVGRSSSPHGWLNHWIQSSFGQDKFVILKVAAIAVLGIALLDALCFYAEKYLTTSVGQWVMHDLPLDVVCPHPTSLLGLSQSKPDRRTHQPTHQRH